MKRAARCIAAGIALHGCVLALSSAASQPSLTECLVASDFVGNAALSRDNGVSAERFIDRLRQDFSLIQAFPEEMRWFVHDQDDEVYLLGAARAVFERPLPAEEHRRTFLNSCFERMAAAPTEAPAAARDPARRSAP
jgi:hypothetical protein